MVTSFTDKSTFDSILLLLHFVLIKAKYRALKCLYRYAARDVHCQRQAGSLIKKAVLATKNHEVLSAALATFDCKR